MTIYLIRHADPDYAHDTLTAKGWREAELLSKRLRGISNAFYYVSPLGRAQDTVSLAVKAAHTNAVTLPWLREFDTGYCVSSNFSASHIAWNLNPSVWITDALCYDKDRWFLSDVYKNSGVHEVYRSVADGLDHLLALHGYVREGAAYKILHTNTDNLLLFCHFGVECVLLSHLLGCSPVILWNNSIALPSSVTVLCTEEYSLDSAVFRMQCFGDLSHLYATS